MSAGKMSPRDSSFAESERNRGSRGDGEKAHKPNTSDSRHGGVNNLTRLHSGASSRASRLDGSRDTMAKSSHRPPPPRSPRSSRRSRSPYRAPRSKRDSISRSSSRSRSRSNSRSPPAHRRGVNARLRSRSPARDGDARTGDKRPRSSNHYHAEAHSDPRRFKVHYERDGETARGGSGPSSRDERDVRDSADTARHAPRTKDEGRLSREKVDVPVHGPRGRKQSPRPHGEAARTRQPGNNSGKANHAPTSGYVSSPRPEGKSVEVAPGAASQPR